VRRVPRNVLIALSLLVSIGAGWVLSGPFAALAAGGWAGVGLLVLMGFLAGRGGQVLNAPAFGAGALLGGAGWWAVGLLWMLPILVGFATAVGVRAAWGSGPAGGQSVTVRAWRVAGAIVAVAPLTAAVVTFSGIATVVGGLAILLSYLLYGRALAGLTRFVGLALWRLETLCAAVAILLAFGPYGGPLVQWLSLVPWLPPVLDAGAVLLFARAGVRLRSSAILRVATLLGIPYTVALGKGVLLLCAAGIAHPSPPVLFGALVVVAVELASVFWGTRNAASPLWSVRRHEAAAYATRSPERERMFTSWVSDFLDRPDFRLLHTIAAEARLAVMREGRALRGRLLPTGAVTPQIERSAAVWIGLLDEFLAQTGVYGQPESPGPGDVLAAHRLVAVADSERQSRQWTEAAGHYRQAVSLLAGQGRDNHAAAVGLELAEMLANHLHSWDEASEIVNSTAGDQRLNAVLRQRAQLLREATWPDAAPLSRIEPTGRDFRALVAEDRGIGMSMGVRAERAYQKRLVAAAEGQEVSAIDFQLGTPDSAPPVRGFIRRLRLSTKYARLINRLVEQHTPQLLGVAVRQQPVLLGDDALRAVDMMIANARDAGDARRAEGLTVIRTFLQDARSHGIDAAVAAVRPGGPLALQNVSTDVEGRRLDPSDRDDALRISEWMTQTEHGPLTPEQLTAITAEAELLPPELLMTLGKLRDLVIEFQHSGEDRLLDEAVDIGMRLLDDPRLRHESSLSAAVEVAAVLLHRYDRTGRADDLVEAEHRLRIALASATDESVSLPEVLVNLAMVLRYRAASGVEPAGLDEAIALLERAVDLPTASLAVANNMLGLSLHDRYVRSGDLRALEGSLRRYESGLAAARPGSPLHPQLHYGRAMALMELYQRTRLVPDLDRSIESYRAAVELTPLRRAWRLMYLDGLLNALRLRFDMIGSGRDLQEAAGLAAEVIALVPESGLRAQIVATNIAHLDLALYGATGDRAWLDRAIALFESAGQEQSESELLYPQVHASLARSLELRAGPGDLDRAVTAYRKAVAVTAAGHPQAVLLAARLWITSAVRRSAWQEVAEAGDPALAAGHRLVLTQLDRTHKEDWLRDLQDLPTDIALARVHLGDPKGAVLALEQGSAVMLSEALQRQRIKFDRLAELGHAALGERYRTASAKLAALTRPADLLSAPVDLDAQDREIGAAVKSLDATAAEIRTIPGYEGFLERPTFDTIEAAARQNPIVYLAAGRSEGVALVVDKGEVTAVPLPDLTAEPVRAYGDKLRAAADLSATVAEITRGLGQMLSPLLPNLGERVTLIPIGHLSPLPLHAVHGMLDRAVVTYSPNALAVTTAARGVSRFEVDRMLIVAAPEPVDGPDLPGAQAEALLAAATFAADVLTGPGAGREAVLAALSSAGIVHFACHGLADPDRPWQSGVLVAGNDLVTVADLIGLGFAARLVVLSACRTAVPGTALPAEVIGLPTAMLQAGATGVVGSLWPVLDSRALLLMACFYERWRHGGLPPAEALRAAQLWMRSTSDGEKYEKFDTLLDGAEWLPAQAARACWEALVLADPDGRSYADPAGWAAFCYVGS
jgi:hypothetical protein